MAVVIATTCATVVDVAAVAVAEAVVAVFGALLIHRARWTHATRMVRGTMASLRRRTSIVEVFVVEALDNVVAVARAAAAVR